MLYCTYRVYICYVYTKVKSAFVRTTKSALQLHSALWHCTKHLAYWAVSTSAVQQRQHVGTTGCRTVFSALSSMFVFDILRLPCGCIQTCIGCIVASCIPPGYGPAFSVKLTVENGRQGNDQCQATGIYLYEPYTSPTEPFRFACPVMCNMYSPVQGCTNFPTFVEPP